MDGKTRLDVISWCLGFVAPHRTEAGRNQADRTLARSRFGRMQQWVEPGKKTAIGSHTTRFCEIPAEIQGLRYPLWRVIENVIVATASSTPTARSRLPPPPDAQRAQARRPPTALPSALGATSRSESVVLHTDAPYVLLDSSPATGGGGEATDHPGDSEDLSRRAARK